MKIILAFYYRTMIMKQSVTLLLLLSIILSLNLAGCSQASNEPLQKKETLEVGNNQVTDKQGQVWQLVTVRYYDFEGGFYGLITESGDKLLPINLTKKYQLSGTKLKVKGEIIKDMMTIQQWGQAFRIADVNLIKIGQNSGAQY